jgi:hypothetical protein
MKALPIIISFVSIALMPACNLSPKNGQEKDKDSTAGELEATDDNSEKSSADTAETNQAAGKIAGVRVGNPEDPGTSGDNDQKNQPIEPVAGLFLACDKTPEAALLAEKGVRCALFDKGTLQVANLDPKNVEWSYSMDESLVGIKFETRPSLLTDRCSFLEFINDVTTFIMNGMLMRLDFQVMPNAREPERKHSIDFKLTERPATARWGEILRKMTIKYKIVVEEKTLESASTPFGDYVDNRCSISFSDQVSGLGSMVNQECLKSALNGCFKIAGSAEGCQLCNKPGITMLKFPNLPTCLQN